MTPLTPKQRAAIYRKAAEIISNSTEVTGFEVLYRLIENKGMAHALWVKLFYLSNLHLFDWNETGRNERVIFLLLAAEMDENQVYNG
jgi:hypothetical protein